MLRRKNIFRFATWLSAKVIPNREVAPLRVVATADFIGQSNALVALPRRQSSTRLYGQWASNQLNTQSPNLRIFIYPSAAENIVTKGRPVRAAGSGLGPALPRPNWLRQ